MLKQQPETEWLKEVKMSTPTRSLYFENSSGRILEEPAGYLRLEYHPGSRKEHHFRALLTHAAQALQRRG